MVWHHLLQALRCCCRRRQPEARNPARAVARWQRLVQVYVARILAVAEQQELFISSGAYLRRQSRALLDSATAHRRRQQ